MREAHVCLTVETILGEERSVNASRAYLPFPPQVALEGVAEKAPRQQTVAQRKDLTEVRSI